MEKKWWHKSVVYQIYPRSFYDANNDGNGDIKGIISKLDYLSRLGIDVIWLSPVYKSPMKDNGYDISDYQDIGDMFGDLDDMLELIAKAKEKNIKILMDLVVNHTSNEHYWFKEALKGKDNKYRDYYIWRDEPNELESIFGGSAWTFDEKSGQYYFHLFAKEQPDLNWENPLVQEEVHQMINWWLEKGVGGFRLDVIDLIGKEIDKKITANGSNLHNLIQQMNKKTFGNYDVLTVGETWGATPEVAKMYSNPKRNEFSMVFQFEHASIDWDQQFGKWVPKELDFIKLKQILNKWQTCFDEDGWNSLFWGNHDLPRIVSRWGDDKEYRVQSAKALATILHFMKGTPYIYQGEEIGMTNVKFPTIEQYKDVEIHNFYQELVVKKQQLSHDEFMNGVYKMGRDNARTPMQWDETDYAGFSKVEPWIEVNQNYKEINVSNDLNNPNSVFHHYQNLIRIRKDSNYSDLIIYGDYKPILENHKDIFAYIRENEEDKILVLVNFSKTKVLLNDLHYDMKEIIISTNNRENHQSDGLTLEPYESLVVSIY